MQPEPITVATVSKRSTTIERCLSAVACQDYAGDIEHIVLVDDLDAVFDAWTRHQARHDFSVEIVRQSGPVRAWQSRVADLRNCAVAKANHPFIAFLDDDNAWEPDHLSSLWQCMSSCGQPHAVHSHRKIFENDGQPFLRRELPWGHSAEARREVFDDYVSRGIMFGGSNVFRDKVGMPHTSVDMGAWLLPRNLLQSCPLDAENPGRHDSTFLPVGEDEILERDLVAHGVAISCTGRATLHYFLGGSTNLQLESG